MQGCPTSLLLVLSSVVMHLLLHTLSGLVLSFSLHILQSSATTDTISAGHALAGGDRLVSSNGKFALGFFQTGSKSSGDALHSYVGIWFNTVPKLTPVWTANGDNPITDPIWSLRLEISLDGNLVAVGQTSGSILWSSTRSKPNTTTNEDTVAVLLASGDLVLRSTSNSSEVLWQSFDHPTDTCLPGAKIGWNKVTGLSTRLVSRKNLIDQASSVYALELEPTRIGQLLWNSSVPYWSTGKWNGRFFNSIPEMLGPAGIFNFTFVDNSQEIYFMYSAFDEKMVVRILVDVSGLSKMHIWMEATQDWQTVNTEPKDQCDVYAFCGPFTICNDNANPSCSCMKGFSIRSPEDWGLDDRSGGCVRSTPLNCGSDQTRAGSSDSFFYMEGVRLPLRQNGQHISAAKSGDDCARICLSNCSCTAYSYEKGGDCSVWHGALLNAKQEYGDPPNADKGEMLYLRLATQEVKDWSRNKIGMITALIIGACFATFGLILVLIIWRRKRRSSTLRLNNVQGGIGIIAFRYPDLQRATRGFSHKLGGGGFGSVYKGFLGDSIAIAVKRLDGAFQGQGEKQFRAEVNSIGIIQHINLVRLIGFCSQGDKRLLVYEYMPNGSLDSHLFQRCECDKSLNWDARYQIALGVARGLAYLHTSCQNSIIHCDIKPQNILLDTSFAPKIADFGMAKVLGREFSRVMTTMRGTIGYLAPEWISGTTITSKVDVYSYGMVLLEILSGKRNSSQEYSSNGDNSIYFPVQVANELLNGGVGSLVDENLQGDVNLEEVERFCKVACWCIQDNEFERPMMGEVVQVLEGLLELDAPPVPRLLHVLSRDAYSMPA